jgi:beta-phosphoglucomutase-like phosphatase (HAD superfamily)
MSIDEVRQLAALLRRTGPVLLDFDGPVCGIFAGGRNAAIASRLREVLAGHGVSVGGELADDPDPLNVLRYTAHVAPRLLSAVEEALIDEEVTAASVATPTPHAHEAIRACDAAGRTVVIVSNNSPAAIRAFIERHQLADYVRAVVGRAHARPDLMKPHPDPVHRALGILDMAPDACVLVGDSDTDVQVALATGVHPIGYAKRPERRSQLAEAGAEVVIDSMETFAAAVRAASCLVPNDARTNVRHQGHLG